MFAKTVVFPWIKRFKTLFISMIMLMGLGMSFAVGMVNAYTSLQDDYTSYIEDYKAPHAYIELTGDIVDYSSEILEKVEEVEYIDSILTFKAATHIDENNRSGNCSIFTYVDPYKDPENGSHSLYYERDSVSPEGLVNPVYVEYTYAKNNNLKAGDQFKIGYLDCFATVTIEKVVSFPDLIEYGPVNGLLSGTTDFGYICTTREVITDIINQLLVKINEKLEIFDPGDEEYSELKAILEVAKTVTYTAITDYEIFIKNEYRNNSDEVLHKVQEYLESQGVLVTAHYTLEDTTSYKVVTSMSKSIRVLAFALPICFYIVVLFVVSLFLNQIVNSLQRDIGVLKAIGVKTKTILGAISLFVFICSILAIIVGISVGIGLSYIMIYLLKKGFALIGWSINAAKLTLPICSAIVLVLFQVAGLISCRSIVKTSPKEAMVEKSDDLKELPKAVNKLMDKASPSFRLAINATIRNFSRVITSIVSLLISISFISVGTSMMFSKERTFTQSFGSLINYDAQIVFTMDPAEDCKDDLKANASVTDIQDVLISNILPLEFNNNEEMINIIAFENDEIGMLKIASSDGESTQNICEENEIILDTTFMTALGISQGDIVTVNGHEIKVASETRQYAISTCYCRYNTLKTIADGKVHPSYLVNYEDLETFEKHLSSHYYMAYPVITDYMEQHKQTKNASIDAAALILNVTFIAFGLLIVTIMSMSNLQSQKKGLSILRALGVSMRRTSNLWLIQLLSHFITAGIFAFPVSYFASQITLNAMATRSVIFPFSDKGLVFLISYSLVLLFVLLSHLFVISIIKKWNIADNTKSKE